MPSASRSSLILPVQTARLPLLRVSPRYFFIMRYNRFGKVPDKAPETGGTTMSQAQSFETDFWKDANLRKVWDDIIPGEPRKTLPYTLTREAIELYCRSVGEDHPLYFDEAYAKTTPYGGLIAPPSIHILLMFACTPADDWMRTPGHRQCGPVMELQHSGASGRRHHLAGARARQVHQARTAVRGARQRLLQPARRRHLFRARPDHSAGVSGENSI